MTRRALTPAEVRHAAATLVRRYATSRETEGDPEGADVLRDCANDVLRMRLTADGPAEPAVECPRSPDGQHQVDTSMESGPNNCFYCSADMTHRESSHD